MNEALIYLQEALGLSAKTKNWPGSARLPLHLRAIEVRAVDANGFLFLLASLPTGVGLPEAKRVYSQLALRAETPVVVSFPDADARQRKALVAQGIPFVCPGRQAFLPFMGTACTERGGARFRNHASKMSPNAQAAAIWGAAQEPYRPYDLCRALGISASRASLSTGDSRGASVASDVSSCSLLPLIFCSVSTWQSSPRLSRRSFLQGRRRRSSILLTPGRRRSLRVRCSLRRAWNKRPS